MEYNTNGARCPALRVRTGQTASYNFQTMEGTGKTRCRRFSSPSSLGTLLYIILLFLPLLEFSKQEEDISTSREALDSNPSLGSFAEDGELMADSYSEVATHTFVKNEHLGATFWNEGEVGLDELSECIRAAQGKSTLERWMECLNASAAHSMASQELPESPTSEISSVEEENGIEFSDLQQQGKKVEEETSDSPDAEFRDSMDTGLVQEMKNEVTKEQIIRPEIIEHHIEESDDIAGTDESPLAMNGSNVDPELPALEYVENEASHVENLESGHSDKLGKVHQGYNISVCLLTNARHVGLSIFGLLLLLKGSSMMSFKKLKMNAQRLALSISSLLVLLKGSSMMNLKKLKMFLAPLTKAKQRVAMKIVAIFDFEGVAKLLDEQETRESVAGCQNDRLIQALSCPLGMAVATVLAEIFENNHQEEQDILADELSKLMRVAIESSLHQLFDGGYDQFAKDFEASFRSTFKMVRLVKRALHDKERTSSHSSGKRVSNSCQLGTDTALNGLATDACIFDPEIECLESLSYKEFCMPSVRGKYQVKLDKKGQMAENSCSPDTVCMKVGLKNPQSESGQEVCSKSNIAMPDLDDNLKFLEVTINSQCEALKEKWQPAGHECLISGMTGVGNVQSNGSSCMNSPKVNIHGNCQAHHVDNDSGEVDSVIEGNNRTHEDVRLESVHCQNNTMRNVSSISTGGPASIAERVGENDACYIQSNVPCIKEIASMPETCHRQQVVMHGHAQHDELSQREIIHLMGSRPEAAALAMFSDRSNMPDSQFRQAFLNALAKSVREQERCNELKSIELMQKIRHFKLEEEILHVRSESNELKRESLDYNISKAMFKKSVFIDQKLSQAYVELSSRCADELAAGLLLMLLALAYGVWMFSRARLLGELALCQTSSKQSHKSSWFYKPMDSVIGPVTFVLQTLKCEVAVVSHMLLGVVTVAIIAYSVLHYRVTSSSQAMPASIILIVLGAVCGWGGKLCVDNLGGSGWDWLVLWEVLCILHAFGSCFTSCLFFILNKPTSSFVKVNLIPLWIRKFAFHTTLLFVLPVMAGLTPFAPVSYWTKHFSNILVENVIEPARVSLQDGIGYFL